MTTESTPTEHEDEGPTLFRSPLVDPTSAIFINNAESPFTSWSNPMADPIVDIRAAMDRIYNAPQRPYVAIVHPQAYDKIQWLLRKTRIDTTYEIIPGALKAKAMVRRLRYRLTRARWAIEDWAERHHGRGYGRWLR